MTFQGQTSIPDKVLDASEKIQLADLLGSPTFRHWIVSGLSNAVQSAHLTDMQADDDDQFLQFRINQMINAIPYEVRRECFNETGRLIRERKNAYASRAPRD
jgi:hypothetical protein